MSLLRYLLRGVLQLHQSLHWSSMQPFSILLVLEAVVITFINLVAVEQRPVCSNSNYSLVFGDTVQA